MVEAVKLSRLEECLKTFKKISLTKLAIEVEAAMEDGKYVLIID